jgi:hypothetical protein
MKNRHFVLISSLLILTVFLSCVSLNGRTVLLADTENIETIGNVEITFTTYQPLHIITKKHKRNILLKAYSKLLAEAQFEYGLGVDVININVKGIYSGHNFWFLPLNYFLGAPTILQNFQKITATGTVITSNYQVPLPITNSLYISKTQMKNQSNSQIQSSDSRQTRDTNSFPQLGVPNILQQTINQMPAIPIAGKNLKFEFGGDVWFAKVNGKNFISGNCIFEENGKGYILTLKTTNVWSGAVEEVIDLFQKIGIPLGPAAGPLRAAAKLATAVAKWIPFNGSSIILEYYEGPPASLRLGSR